MSSTRTVLSALTKRCGFQLEMTEALIGGAAIDAVNDPFPDESLQQCLNSDSVLLSCIGGYKWDGNPRELRPETGLLKMRKEMGLFANLRPAKVLDQLIDASTLKREVVEGVDVMCVRELTGDVYFGTPKGIDVVDGKAFSICLYSLYGRCMQGEMIHYLVYLVSKLILIILFQSSCIIREKSWIQQHDLQRG